jgi:predicted heme/steroid binding protein
MFWERLRELRIAPSPSLPDLWARHDDPSRGWLDWEIEKLDDVGDSTSEHDESEQDRGLLVALRELLADLGADFDEEWGGDDLVLSDGNGDVLTIYVTGNEFDVGASFSFEDGTHVSETVTSISIADLGAAAAEIRKAFAHLPELKADPGAIF